MRSVMQMRPLCITDLPRYTRFTNAFGTSVSKASGDATEPYADRCVGARDRRALVGVGARGAVAAVPGPAGAAVRAWGPGIRV